MRLLTHFLAVLSVLGLNAQFAPKAGMPGSTAIHKDSGIFISWAKTCTVNLGPRHIQYPDSGLAAVGIPEYATSYSDPGVISLGDGGSAVLTFDPPIVDGPGYDFAVFENGFEIRGQNDSDFLELAFVEVSSDGVNFFRFFAETTIDTSAQLGTYDGSKAYQIHNLAGKYIARYGTPFDLNELEGTFGLDVNSISHIRIIDVVGSLIDSLATYDGNGRKINDPWPTPFPQSGFDLEAIGVIYNQHSPNGISSVLSELEPYPNPVQKGQNVVLPTHEGIRFRLWDAQGKSMGEDAIRDNELFTSNLKPGVYLLNMYLSDRMQSRTIIVKP